MKIEIPERVRTGFSFGERSATSTYKRIERVLSSSTPHGGWRAFILENIFISVTLILGLLLCLSACAYTRNLSTHLLVCPDWAEECEIRPYITWNANNLALVQGIVTVIYSIGLMLMTCSVRSTAESVIWPILTRHPLTFDQIETYLAIARGQVFATSPALHMLRWNHTATFILLTLSVLVMSFAVAPLIGFVFAISDVPRQFSTTYRAGNGNVQAFIQTNPPTSMDIDALVEYQSWSRNLTEEPMPEYQDWMVNRNVLKKFHRLEAYAIRTVIGIECDGREIEDYVVTRSNTVRFTTSMGQRNSGEREAESSDNVEVAIHYSHSALSVWVDDFEFSTSSKSSASLIFVAINGTIENGEQLNMFGRPLMTPLSFSTIACDVEIELRDEMLQVGSGTHQQEFVPVLSSTEQLTAPHQNGTNTSALNELALWLAVAPVLVGASIRGLQPSYSKSDNGFARVLSDIDSPSTPEDWTIAEIKSFIQVAIGAVALSSSRKSNEETPPPITLSVQALTRKMIPERVVFLLIPIAFVLASNIILVCLSIHLHRQHKIPIMRLASVSEFLKSSQSKFLSMELMADARESGDLSGIGELQVMFGLTRGMQAENDELVAGLSSEIEPFEGGGGTMLRTLVPVRQENGSFLDRGLRED